MRTSSKLYTIGCASKAPRQGEIWLADSIPFDGGTGCKSRPVVFKKREENWFVCFKCTSQCSTFRNRYPIMDLEEAGLDKDSYIDYDPIFVFREQLLYRMGVLSEEDITNFGKL